MQLLKQKQRRVKPYDVVSFTNQYGETLQPGDKAVASTTCSGSGNLRVGIYCGLHGGRVVLEVAEPSAQMTKNGTVDEDLVHADVIAAIDSVAPNYQDEKYNNIDLGNGKKAINWREYRNDYSVHQGKIQEHVAANYYKRKVVRSRFTQLKNNNVRPLKVVQEDLKDF